MRILASFLLALLAACTGAGTINKPRRLDAAVTSAYQYGSDFVSPAALKKWWRNLITDTSAMTASELQRFGGISVSLRHAAASETSRLKSINDQLTLTATELQRLQPAVLATRSIISQSMQNLVQLRQSMEKLPAMLGMTKRFMAETDDLQNRTDLNDTRPEASLFARFQRRIFP
jgi:hypothetical protein